MSFQGKICFYGLHTLGIPMLRSTRRNKKRNGFVEMDFIRYGMADGKRIHTGSSHLPDRNQDILERLMKDGNIYYCNDNFYSSGRSSIFRYKEQGGRQKFLRMRRKLRRRVSGLQGPYSPAFREIIKNLLSLKSLLISSLLRSPHSPQAAS